MAKTDELKGKIQLAITVLMCILIVGTLLGISAGTMNFIVGLFTSAIVGMFLSFIAGSLVEAFSGDTLKKYFLNIPITDDFSISVSFFFIATALVKLLIFP